jgi:hypothetical protein
MTTKKIGISADHGGVERHLRRVAKVAELESQGSPE